MIKIEVEGPCTCGKIVKLERMVSNIEILESCRKAVDESPVFKADSKEDKRHYVITLFIQNSKQPYKRYT